MNAATCAADDGHDLRCCDTTDANGSHRQDGALATVRFGYMHCGSLWSDRRADKGPNHRIRKRSIIEQRRNRRGIYDQRLGQSTDPS